MRANIIVRHADNQLIAQLFEVESLDDQTVKEAVRSLEQHYSPRAYCIDTSQIEHARRAQQPR